MGNECPESPHISFYNNMFNWVVPSCELNTLARYYTTKFDKILFLYDKCEKIRCCRFIKNEIKYDIAYKWI